MSASMNETGVWSIVGWSTVYYKDAVSCYVIVRNGKEQRDFKFAIGDDVKSFVENAHKLVQELNDEERSDCCC